MRVSQYYNLGKTQPSLPFVDVDTSKDTRLFVNPRAIKNLHSEWGEQCQDLIQDFFSELLTSVAKSDTQRSLQLLSHLKEPNETHLGLSKGESDGRGLGPKKAKKIWRSFNSSKAAKTGVLTDLEDTVLLIEGISNDILSDITTNIVRGPLIEFTQRVAEEFGIPLEEEVVSGPFWNSSSKKWESAFVPLPVADGDKLLLVPKSIVRLDSGYNVGKYYRNYILEALKEEELQKNSSLVEIMKSGKNKGDRKVFKKDLKDKYGKEEKTVSIEQTNRRPDVFAKYKKENSEPTPALSHRQIAEAQDTEPPNWDELLKAVLSLEPGKRSAYKYEDAILNLLVALFYPVLVDPETQTPIHNGLKRVDITFTNNAFSGFFSWLARNYNAPYIFVECKNFGDELGNPELDQIAMRMSDGRGRFGLLVCRKLEDKKRMLERCKAASKDGHAQIVVLDDSDLKSLVEEAKVGYPPTYEFPTLREKFKKLVF